MINIDLILKEKEDLYHLIESKVSSYMVVTLKANIPGSIKNNSQSLFLLDYFHNKIMDYNPLCYDFLKSVAGNVFLYYFPRGKELKKIMIKLELGPIGRLVDIDVYKNEVSIKRKKPRKCFLCDNEAFYCIKNKTHSIIELNSYIEDSIHDYLKKELIKYLNYCFDKELELNPKFGLVSKWSKGSHKDMNYQMMIKSKKVIIPHLLEMFSIGYYNEIDSILKPIRIIGKLAESDMLSVTNGINTYKGLIFGLGIVVSAFGYYTRHYGYKSLSNIIKEISAPLDEDFKDIKADTYGLKSYDLYKIKGARGNAIDGYNIIFDLINDNNLKTKDDLYRALFYLVYNASDTVLLKRTKSLAKYKEVKDLFSVYDKKLIRPLTKYSIKNNLSFGGSADLLSISLFLKIAEDKLGISYKKEGVTNEDN